MKYSDKEKKRKIKKILGFRPKNFDLYNLAFIHKSATYINHKGEIINNERLEFLGDSIIDAVISDYLYNNFPDFNEGKLTQSRSKLVNTKQLAYFSKNLGINEFLETHTENNLNSKHLYADTLEAFIGAIFLDRGFKKTYKFIKKKLIKITDLKEIINTETNHKSRLIELSQKDNFEVDFVTEAYEKDNFNFVAKILIDNKQAALGLGTTKKEAEQKAAKIAMCQLNPKYNNGEKKIKNKT